MESLVSLLRCIKCGAPLLCLESVIVCEQCSSTWPIANGIPRFFQSETHYWGEVGRIEAREMLEAARKGPWRDAVLGRFSKDANMHHGLLDLQRASWAPALGIDEDSVILDIGSGYGAITHSLAESAGEV